MRRCTGHMASKVASRIVRTGASVELTTLMQMWKGVEDGTGSARCSVTKPDSDKNVLDLVDMNGHKDEFESRMGEDDENENHVKRSDVGVPRQIEMI